MRRWLALAWLAVVLAAVVHVALLSTHGVPRETDIMALLPREGREPEILAAKDRVARALSGRVVVMVGHAERDRARAQAGALRAALTGAALVRPDSDVPDDAAVQRLGTAYFAHRAGLLAEDDRRALLAGQGEALVRRALSQVYGFGGAVESRLLARDPFLLFPAAMAGLPMPSGAMVMDEGLPTVTEDGTVWVLLSLRLTGEPFDLDFQNRFIAAFDAARPVPADGFRVLRLGAVFFAQAGAERAMGETSRIGTVSLAGTILLVVLAFRSARPLLLSLAAVGAGLVTALSVCLALFGALHVAAQMFGAALIGIAVDYALLYFGQVFTPRTDPVRRLGHVLPGLGLGAATTIIGYGALALSPFPGLRQVAVFSAVGLAGSFLSVVLWFPLLDRCRAASLDPGLAAAAGWLWRFWGEAGFVRWRRLALLALAGLGLLGLARLEMDDDIRRQQGLSPVLAAEQAEIQRLAGFGQAGRFFLVQGDGEQQVLEREEALDERLSGLSGRQMAARFVPSARRQADNAALAGRALYVPHLAAYRARLGMAVPAEAGEAPPPPLSLAEIRASGGLPFLDGLILGEGLHVVTVDGQADTALLRAAAAGLDGVRFVDPTGDLNLLLAAYRQRAVALVAVSVLLMVPLLAWRYGAKGAVRVMAPAAAAVALTPPLLALAGVGFSFFGAMALVLVLSIGTDYAVFCAEDRQRDPVTLFSVGLAMLTTLLSFGLLGLSEAAAVRAFGATMLVGVALSFLLAPSAGRRR